MAPRGLEADHVGPYRILRALESAGTPSFIAREEGPVGFRRDVVLKLVSENDPSQAFAAQELAQEATLGSRLNHPNIVRTHDFFAQDGRLVLVVEHVEGITMAQLLLSLRLRGERLSDQAALYVGVAVLEALAHAHAQVDASGARAPIVHQRLVPSRVALGRDGSVKLGGFTALAVPGGHVDAGDQGANLAPVAPLEGEKANVRAAGLLLWEMLTGREAAAGIEPLSVIRGDLPRELSAAVGAALDVANAKRGVGCAEVASWIKKVARFAGGRDEIRAHVMALAPPAEPEPSALDVPGESTRIPLQGWSVRLAPLASKMLSFGSGIPRLDAAARSRLVAMRASIATRWPKLDALLRQHPRASMGTGVGFVLVLVLLAAVRIFSRNTAHAAVPHTAANAREGRFVAAPGAPPVPSALSFLAAAAAPSPAPTATTAKVALVPAETAQASPAPKADHAAAPAADKVEPSAAPAGKAINAIPGGATRPAHPPPKGFGYLTVHSSIGYASVYVQLVRYGQVEHRLLVRCGKRFLSLGNPKPTGGEPTWFAPSRTVDIPCGSSLEITIMPKWIPKGG